MENGEWRMENVAVENERNSERKTVWPLYVSLIPEVLCVSHLGHSTTYNRVGSVSPRS
jgi:hypothetical protein